MIKWQTEKFSSINNLKYNYMYMHIWKKCHNEYGNKILKKKPHSIHVVILWTIGMSIRCYKLGRGEDRWMCISSSACMHVYQCNYPAHHSHSTLLLENKPFVGSDPAGFVFYKKENRTRQKFKHSDFTRRHTWLEVNSMWKLYDVIYIIVFIKIKCINWNNRYKNSKI